MAINCIAEMNVVFNAVPFHSITEFESNPPPVAVNVNEPLPVATLVGEIDVSVGVAADTRNCTPEDVPPPGPAVTTWTMPFDGVVSNAAGMVAVSCDAETTVVGRAVVTDGVAVVVHWAIDVGTKPEP